MFYVTARALTTGIEVFDDAQAKSDGDGRLYVNWWYARSIPRSQWFPTEAKAQEAAAKMRAKKIALLERQIAKLKALDGFMVVRRPPTAGPGETE